MARRIKELEHNSPDWVEVAGFKSIHDPLQIAMRPVTVLAGPNSSGKSSAFQPLLLLKQSLDVSFAPNPLVLSGDHLRFTSLDEFLSRGRSKNEHVNAFHVTFGARNGGESSDHPGESVDLKLTFQRDENNRERLTAQTHLRGRGDDAKWVAVDEAHQDELIRVLGMEARHVSFVHGSNLVPTLFFGGEKLGSRPTPLQKVVLNSPLEWVRGILHIPGHRGYRDRRYPVTNVARNFWGTLSVTGPMPPYAASLLLEWQRQAKNGSSAGPREKQAKQKLQWVNDGMRTLGLTWKVQADEANAADLRLRVGRMPKPVQGGARDLVDIADVGFGVSQVLPVLVALAAASPGQMVLIEQPELHLHPRAQLAMGELLVDAGKRKVIVVIETHSPLLIRAIQTAVAKNRLRPSQVALHWFSRNEKTGWTTAKRADVGEDGSLGDWPIDFPDVFAMADSAFLEAVFEGKPRR